MSESVRDDVAAIVGEVAHEPIYGPIADLRLFGLGEVDQLFVRPEQSLARRILLNGHDPPYSSSKPCLPQELGRLLQTYGLDPALEPRRISTTTRRWPVVYRDGPYLGLAVPEPPAEP